MCVDIFLCKLFMIFYYFKLNISKKDLFGKFQVNNVWNDSIFVMIEIFI